jgi:demethylmenaquinone methyltransferase/2-methoxy-6-polyprenyl-1,4-benzoquinol methylase
VQRLRTPDAPAGAATKPLFDRLAPGYDRGNRAITLGQDLRWKRHAVALLGPRPGGCYLDCGAGTGDLTKLILHDTRGQAQAIALDASREMMDRGGLPGLPGVRCVVADAAEPGLPDGSMDGVVTGFLLRHIADPAHFFASMRRLLKPGGRLVVLEVALPRSAPLRVLFRAYFHGVVPLLGGLATGQWRAYRYLSRSLRRFPAPQELARIAAEQGLGAVRLERRRLSGIFFLVAEAA